MAVPPRFAGQKIQLSSPAPGPSSGPPTSTHTLELYLDFNCPFSARLFKRLTTEVFPLVRSQPGHPAQNLTVILRQQVQPWHPCSAFMHEAGLAVLRLAPEKFWAFVEALFAVQTDYHDVNIVHEARNQSYRRLAKVAASVGVDEEAVYKLLEIPDKPSVTKDNVKIYNVGNAVTNDLKFIVKQNRLVGVHVTPTVVFNGVVQNEISSGWNLEQWKEWIDKNVD